MRRLGKLTLFAAKPQNRPDAAQPVVEANPMFKKTSDNSQRRQRMAILESRVNSAGVDDAAFKKVDKTFKKLSDPLALREELILRKTQLQHQLTLLKHQMTVGKGVSRSKETHEHLATRRTNMITEIQAIDVRLSKLAIIQAQKKLDAQETFEMAFFAVAKELLANDVLKRLINATILRCGAGPQAAK